MNIPTNADTELREDLLKIVVTRPNRYDDSSTDNVNVGRTVDDLLVLISSFAATAVNEKLEGLGKQIEDITQREFVHGENSQDFDEGRMYEQFQNKEALRSLIRKAKI